MLTSQIQQRSHLLGLQNYLYKITWFSFEKVRKLLVLRKLNNLSVYWFYLVLTRDHTTWKVSRSCIIVILRDVVHQLEHNLNFYSDEAKEVRVDQNLAGSIFQIGESQKLKEEKKKEK